LSNDKYGFLKIMSQLFATLLIIQERIRWGRKAVKWVECLCGCYTLSELSMRYERTIWGRNKAKWVECLNGLVTKQPRSLGRF